MSTIVKLNTNGHWYEKNGSPCYEVPYADPLRGMRKTTLADARKFNLYPSVTSILSVIHKPALDAWKVEQGIVAALTLPREDGEGEDAFAMRVAKDAAEVASKAADFGNAVHQVIEGWLVSGEHLVSCNGYSVKSQIDAYIVWHEKNVLESLAVEEPFCYPLSGYGGKRDIVVKLKNGDEAVLDIKTTKTVHGKPIRGYIEQGMQLAAYGMPTVNRIINVFLSSTEPGRLDVVDWSDKRDDLFSGFCKARDLFFWLKKYDPREESE